uniref:Ovule protein n=1 Tax=Ascaris lumbricoides TaxID=6252 RepID=A0A0M3IEU0_ASCLU
MSMKNSDARRPTITSASSSFRLQPHIRCSFSISHHPFNRKMSSTCRMHLYHLSLHLVYWNTTQYYNNHLMHHSQNEPYSLTIFFFNPVAAFHDS